MVAVFFIICFAGLLSLIALQVYEQPNLIRKVLIHVGIVFLVIISLAITISCFKAEVTFTHITQRADFYGSMHFNKVMQIDYDIVHYDWRSWSWLQSGSVVHLTITDDNGNKIVTE